MRRAKRHAPPPAYAGIVFTFPRCRIEDGPLQRVVVKANGNMFADGRYVGRCSALSIATGVETLRR